MYDPENFSERHFIYSAPTSPDISSESRHLNFSAESILS